MKLETTTLPVRIVMAILLGLSAGSLPNSTSFSQDEVLPQLQYQLLDMQNELEVIKDKLNLETGQIEQISKALSLNAKQAAKRAGDKTNKDMPFYSPNLDAQLREDIWAKAKELLPREKLDLLDEYIADARKLSELYDQYGQECMIKFMDDYLCLSRVQQARLEQELKANWDSFWNSDSVWLLMGIQRSNVRRLQDLDRDTLETILTREQLSNLDRIEDFKSAYSNFQSQAMQEGENWAAKELSEHCTQLTQLKIAEIKANCELTEAQVEKLKYACKGAAAEVIRNWKTWAAMMSDDKTPPMNKQIRTMQLGMQPLLYQCTSRTIWQRTLKNTLTDRQLETLDEIEKGRAETCVKQMSVYSSLFMFNRENQLRMTFDQHKALMKMLIDNLSVDSGGNGWEASVAIVQIDDAKFQDVLDDNQWQKVKRLLDSQRAMLAEIQNIK